MINLIPPERVTMYRYARRNAQLRRWIVACGLGLSGLAIITLAGIWYIRQQVSDYNLQAETAQTNLSAQKQAQTDRQAKDISGSIKLAVQVLNKEILFSDLLKQLAAITPNDVALSNLNISQVKGALDITASAATYEAGSQLQVNLADPANKIFSQADIVSITCASKVDSATVSAAKYPCTVVIRALFAPNNPYLFTTNRKAGS